MDFLDIYFCWAHIIFLPHGANNIIKVGEIERESNMNVPEQQIKAAFSKTVSLGSQERCAVEEKWTTTVFFFNERFDGQAAPLKHWVGGSAVY